MSRGHWSGIKEQGTEVVHLCLVSNLHDLINPSQLRRAFVNHQKVARRVHMIKVHILAQCEHCNGEAHLPEGEAENYIGERLTRYLPCPQGHVNNNPDKWIILLRMTIFWKRRSARTNAHPIRAASTSVLAISGMTSQECEMSGEITNPHRAAPVKTIPTV